MSIRALRSSPAPGRLLAGSGAALSLCQIGTLIGSLWLVAGPAAGQAFQTARGDLLLRGAGGETFVQLAGRERVELPLSPAARVSDFRSGADAWLAAAVDLDGGLPKLEVLRGRGAEVESLGAPPEPAAEILQPVFVARKGELQALVWLAGEAHDRHAVRASRWLGDGWAAPETVSPPGKGTQIALSTAVLADGTWLAVWSAFDGRDDEILWSRHAAGVWSPPRPVAADNEVPDITPSLFPTADGALIAWSRYDGNDYRVNVARFDGRGFSAPLAVGAPGSTAPAFADAAAPYLIYHLADPPAWAVAELDAAGAVLRQAATDSAQPERPVLAAVTGETVTLEWPGGERRKVFAPLAWTLP